MIIRAFNIAIATDFMPNSVSQAMHSDVENNVKDEFFVFLPKPFSHREKEKKKKERKKEERKKFPIAVIIK